MNKQAVRNCALSVVEWRKLTQEGLSIPVRIQLNGYSMQPLVRRLKDHVTIIPLKRPLKRGDVVLFADDLGRYVVHRVWKLEENRVITLGDNCKYPDAPLRYDQIWGLVTKVERGSRAIDLNSAAAKAYGHLWMALYPMRTTYYKTRAFGGRIYRKLKGR